MPKKDVKQVNTLLNYFKSPKSVTPQAERSTPKEKSEPTTPVRALKGRGKGKGKENKDEVKATAKKRPLKARTPELDEEEEVKKEDEEDEIAAKPKRRRIIIPEEDSEDGGDDSDDYVPEESEEASESEDNTEGATESSFATETETDEETPKKKQKLSRGKSNGKNWRSKQPPAKVTLKEESFQLQKTPSVTGPTTGGDSWPHLKLDFLQPENRRDKNRRRPTDENYDPRTLHVPEDFLNKQTPAMRQWWVLKSQHFDCILFFKVGKFYELYHMDAVTGSNELGIAYMRGEWAHSGFPEIAYGRFSGILVEKGYKVARIEQTENPEMMQERVKRTAKSTKFDKVVKREICQISTRGTRVSSVQDPEIITPESNYLLSLVEKTDAKTKIPKFGVCFIDTSIGEFHLGEFEDDRSHSRLLTLLSHYLPVHVVYEKGKLSQETLKIINTLLSSALKEPLQKDVQFWSASKTLKFLHEGDYFKSESGSDFQWPEGLKAFLNPGDSLGLTPDDDKELAVNALGGCVYILKDFMLDQQILGQKHFQEYIPPDVVFSSRKMEEGAPAVSTMVLDAITINNLRILGEDGSLLKTLDHCCTAFGKRLLKEWICRPSCRKNIIVSRQEAITELMDNPDVIQETRKSMSHLPDLERLLSKIYTHGSAQKMKNHPDGRAFMFESQTYSKKKISDFTTALEGFENAVKIASRFEDFQSPLIKRTLQRDPEGEFPDLEETLEYFKTAFDHEKAKKEGNIVPKEGVDAEYDEIIEEFRAIKHESNSYLKQQEKYFGGKVTFAGNDKKRFQLEVPEARAKHAGSSHELQGQRKGFKKYYTAECREFLARQMKAEEQRDKILKDLSRRIFAKFSEKYDLWSSAVFKIATLDVLISFAEYARSGETCVPQINDDDEVFTVIKEGKHPCISSDNFVPNDTSISAEGNASLLILTGPNMGGKSTLMRQVGLITVMAQIGSYVPAAECKLTLVDRIFTRLGASDDILTGRSTFLVELSETAMILQHATKKSLVLLDELGRGTSTYDGTAIAAAVVDALTKLKCRTLFSTHYHSLVEDFEKNENVSLGHMACEVETEEEEGISEETVTFLYKLVQGACPKSHGFNAARLAGIPASITRRAREIAGRFEKEANQRQVFTSLCRGGNDVNEIIGKLKSSLVV
ncbi:probable DNA mismatch repair protein Msh6 [Diachasma alloeum]|uniref:DNA mismatch repair protein n=1 Tax=Diachasma alloeum TaxID=454923 RepID=A0A4E0S0Z9_9HYME|nr:probable DNA mismatch repair protein Msh6 [Diachasma alloeum]THK32980.1 mutS 6-like [Diachasma alloeum]